MDLDAEQIEAALDYACRALRLTESDTAWVMSSHRASVGDLTNARRLIGPAPKNYVRCWMAVRDQLGGRDRRS